MSQRTYTCGCGKEFTWTSGTAYPQIILTAQEFLMHRHDAAHPERRTPCEACRIPRRLDVFQALDDIKWAARELEPAAAC